MKPAAQLLRWPPLAWFLVMAVTVSPHKAWGPQTNGLVRQLHQRRISQAILGGMLANVCARQPSLTRQRALTGERAITTFSSKGHVHIKFL